MVAKQQFCPASKLVSPRLGDGRFGLVRVRLWFASTGRERRATSEQAAGAADSTTAYAEADAAYYRARAGALATEATDEIARTDFWRLRRGRLYVPDASNIQELEERLADAARSESAAGVLDASAALLATDQAISTRIRCAERPFARPFT